MPYKFNGDDFRFETVHKDDERSVMRVFVRIGVSIDKVTKRGVTTYKPYISPVECLGDYGSLEDAVMALTEETIVRLERG